MTNKKMTNHSDNNYTTVIINIFIPHVSTFTPNAVLNLGGIKLPVSFWRHVRKEFQNPHVHVKLLNEMNADNDKATMTKRLKAENPRWWTPKPERSTNILLKKMTNHSDNNYTTDMQQRLETFTTSGRLLSS